MSPPISTPTSEPTAPQAWPSPDATHEEIAAFYRKNTPPPEPAHEVPAVENGPSPVCNACGVVRVSLLTPFCRTCQKQMEGGW